MRGGALIPRDINNHDISGDLDEEDYERMDQIQATFTGFVATNLSYAQSTARRINVGIKDTGESDYHMWGQLHGQVERANMYNLLNAALGRVELEGGYRAKFLDSDTIDRLLQDMWTQDHGRSGGRNRYMGILANDIDIQHQSYRDVNQYEGHPLPSVLPIVLHESEWDQIATDVLDDWPEYDPEDPDDNGPIPDGKYARALTREEVTQFDAGVPQYVYMLNGEEVTEEEFNAWDSQNEMRGNEPPF